METIQADRSKKAYIWGIIFAAGLAAGTWFMNYFAVDAPLSQNGLWGIRDVDKVAELAGNTQYFIHILIKRLGFFIFLAGTTLLIRRSLLLYLSTAYYGFCFGVVISMMTVMYGVNGWWMLLLFLLPHYALYVLGYLLLLRVANAVRYRTAGHSKFVPDGCGWQLAWAFVLYLAGCILESYVNPLGLQFFLKNFL